THLLGFSTVVHSGPVTKQTCHPTHTHTHSHPPSPTHTHITKKTAVIAGADSGPEECSSPLRKHGVSQPQPAPPVNHWYWLTYVQRAHRCLSHTHTHTHTHTHAHTQHN